MSVARRFPRSEVKYSTIHAFDNTLADEAVSVNLAFTNLGVQPSQRIGRLIQGLTLRYHMTAFTTNSTNAGAEHSVRVIFVRWQDDTVPSIDQILTPTTTIESPYNYSQQAKWKILSDKTYDLNLQTRNLDNSLFMRVSRSEQGVIKTNWRCEYDLTEDDQDRGSIYCFLVSSTESNIRVKMFTTFSFTDL